MRIENVSFLCGALYRGVLRLGLNDVQWNSHNFWILDFGFLDFLSLFTKVYYFLQPKVGFGIVIVVGLDVNTFNLNKEDFLGVREIK